MGNVIAVGESDFPSLIRNDGYFVDKTRVICELMDAHNKVTLFTRPRRFGKTLTMSMLRAYFDIEHKDEVEELFAGTEIQAADARYRAAAGSRPVVFLSLKDAKQRNGEALLDDIRTEMSVLFDAYTFLEESPRLSPAQKSYFHRVIAKEESAKELQISLRQLTAMLHVHYGQPVVLLLDEYDTPIEFAHERGYYEEAMDFLRNFFSSALKDNPSVDFAVLTGILRIAKESIFSGLNNLTVSTVVSGGFADAFGFTQEEIEDVAKTLGYEEHLSELRTWYDGYDVQGVDIYNPWSVMSYFQSGCRTGLYWQNTSGNGILHELLQNADEDWWQELSALADGGTVMAELREHTVYENLRRNRNELYSVLLFAGYLKAVQALPSGGRQVCELAIPNAEIRAIFTAEVVDFLEPAKGNVTLFAMKDAMVRGDAARFEQLLQDILRRAVGIHDAARPESFYHGLMLGFVLYYESSYRVESNLESGYGRFDIAMFPKKRSLPGILMEFKTVKREKEMARAAERAHRQIKERSYATRLREYGVDDVWTYGIAFCGKHVELVGGKEKNGTTS